MLFGDQNQTGKVRLGPSKVVEVGPLLALFESHGSEEQIDADFYHLRLGVVPSQLFSHLQLLLIQQPFRL